MVKWSNIRFYETSNNGFTFLLMNVVSNITDTGHMSLVEFR
jgi:hypothetical protein